MAETSAIQIPHGLSDPEGKFAFVSGPQGFIYRLDLGSGERLAHTDFPGRPLALYGDKLIGWAPAPGSGNSIRLFAVTTMGRDLVLAWDQILTLPAWVEVISPEHEAFTLAAELPNEELLINWKARTRYSGGAPPPPGVETAETRAASAVLSIDPNDGSVLKETRKDFTPGSGQTVPELQESWRIVPYLLNETWVTQPWLVNSQEAFLMSIAGEPGIILVRRDPGSTDKPDLTQLSESPAAEVAVTPDGEFVFVHENRNASPKWLIYSVKTGNQLAILPFDHGTLGVSLVSDRVLYLVVQELGPTRRKSLCSRDIHTGDLMWSFTLGEETVSMAPPPPP